MFHLPADPVAAAPFPLSFTTHTTASSICNAAYQHLIRTQAQEINTHVILSYILKLCIFEGSSPISPSLLLSSPIPVTSGSELSPSPPPLVPGSLWIAGWSGPPHNRSLRFIVSLTQGQTGQHPLFVVDLAPGTMDAPSIRSAMNTVVTQLVGLDPTVVGRVYAVFGPRPFAQALSEAWYNQTNAIPTSEPNLAACYMECTNLTPHQDQTPIPGHRIRRAGSDDADLAAELCKSYSPYPYTLSLEDARQEARTLIADRVLYFYEVPTGTGGYCVASMLAVGRRSANVACITKVYTLPNFKEKGYAFRLLHHVCSRLFNQGVSAVVSYVPFGNVAYQRLVAKTGFAETSPGYSEWLEIGFEDVDMGHW